MSHANATLTPRGRLRLARCVVEDGWPLRRAAERFQVSVSTAARWAGRYREHGPEAMTDRSSPRYALARLSWLDRGTAAPIRRYEHSAPGDLVHVDIKKLGRIPDGGGHRMVGKARGNRNKTGTEANRRPGYAYLHNAVDDHSRLAYTEILSDERKDTAAGFWERANAFFAGNGITVARVLTDNGSCYRSKAFAEALGTGIKHKFTRPYRPQTNGKVERYNRTMVEEWAYAKPYRSEAERIAAFPAWLHAYIITAGTPYSRVNHRASRVPNLSGQYD